MFEYVLFVPGVFILARLRYMYFDIILYVMANYEMSLRQNGVNIFEIRDNDDVTTANRDDVSETAVEAFTTDVMRDDVISQTSGSADVNTCRELSGSTVSLEVDFDCSASNVTLAGKAQKYVVKRKTSPAKKFRTCFFLTCMVVVLTAVTISIILGYYGKLP